MEHDAHAAPPSGLRVLFKQWQKSSRETVDSDPDVLDTSCLDIDSRVSKFSIDDEHQASIARSFEQFMCDGSYASRRARVVCFEVKALPGGHSLPLRGIVPTASDHGRLVSLPFFAAGRCTGCAT